MIAVNTLVFSVLGSLSSYDADDGRKSHLKNANHCTRILEKKGVYTVTSAPSEYRQSGTLPGNQVSTEP